MTFTFTGLSAIRVVSSAYLRLFIFLPAILIPAYASSIPAFLMMYSAFKLNKQDYNIQPWCTLFPIWNKVCCSMSSSNCCFLTCIQISQEAGQVVLYPLLFKNFPQLLWSTQSKALVYSQWSRSRCFYGISLAFSMIQYMLAIWSLVPLPFLNPAWKSGSSWFTYSSILAWRTLSIALLL